MLRLVPLSVIALLAAPAAVAADTAASLDDEVRLNASITVTGDSVRLGDIFSGYLSRPEKVVAQAPHPGQRMVLSAEWLSNLARTYGLSWHPVGEYDRAIVHQPGKTVSAQDILGAVKAALIQKGLDANSALIPVDTVGSVTVASASDTDIGVREAFFDPATKVFSAVVEIPAGDPKATFIPLRGGVYATVTVPVLKENVAKNTVITPDMIDFVPVRDTEVKSTTVVSLADIVGRVPKSFIKAGLPVQQGDIAAISLVDVPVLSIELGRDSQIETREVTTAKFNAAELPSDVILDPSQMIGRTPRRLIPAGAPLRHSDVQIVRKIMVPVTIRDLPRGETLTAADLSAISMNDAEVVANVLTDASEIVGRATKHMIHAGQPMHSFDIARPTAVERGRPITIVYTVKSMNLTVQGVAQESGGVGDVIRVTNSKSNQTFGAEIVDAHTVRVLTQQTASVN